MSSFDRLSHFKSIFDNFLHRPIFLKIPKTYRGKITIYACNFQQVNLTPNGGVSSAVSYQVSSFYFMYFYTYYTYLASHLSSIRKLYRSAIFENKNGNIKNLRVGDPFT